MRYGLSCEVLLLLFFDIAAGFIGQKAAAELFHFFLCYNIIIQLNQSCWLTVRCLFWFSYVVMLYRGCHQAERWPATCRQKLVDVDCSSCIEQKMKQDGKISHLLDVLLLTCSRIFRLPLFEYWDVSVIVVKYEIQIITYYNHGPAEQLQLSTYFWHYPHWNNVGNSHSSYVFGKSKMERNFFLI